MEIGVRSGTVSSPVRKFDCAPRPQLRAPSKGAAAWKFEIQINIRKRGIVNARHKATPELPYTHCLTHPDVYPRCLAGRVARILFACGIYSLQLLRAAFNETTLILPESRLAYYALNRPVILNWIHYSAHLLKTLLGKGMLSQISTNETRARAT